jgi:hypothetical protein
MSFFSIPPSGPTNGPDQIPLGETDDISLAVARPSTRRAPHRESRRPPACIRSMSDENGRRMAASAKSIVYRYATRRSGVPAFFNYLLNRPLDFRERRREGRASRVDNNVPLGSEFNSMQAKRFAKAAFDSISDHRTAQSPGRGEPQSCAGIFARLACKTECREQWAGYADAVVIDDSVVGGAQNPGGVRKSERAGGLSSISQCGRLSRH